jgi:carboxypeptidase-like protein
MNLRLTNLLLLTFFAMNCFSQNTSTVISGKIVSFNNYVHNVHIINLNNKRGTISDNLGNFKIRVKVNDTLLLSAIQYQNLKIIITKSHIKSKIIKIYLEASITNLDEVFLHGLTGNLNSDINTVPKDTLPNHNFIYKLSDLDKVLPPDTKAPEKAPFVGPFKSLPATATFPDYYMIKVRKLKRELRSKKSFPSKIKSELGIEYFTKILNIPEEKINHFLSYCEYRNIIKEYNQNNLLQVIKILQEESKSYHAIKY